MLIKLTLRPSCTDYKKEEKHIYLNYYLIKTMEWKEMGYTVINTRDFDMWEVWETPEIIQDMIKMAFQELCILDENTKLIKLDVREARDCNLKAYGSVDDLKEKD